MGELDLRRQIDNYSERIHTSDEICRGGAELLIEFSDRMDLMAFRIGEQRYNRRRTCGGARVLMRSPFIDVHTDSLGIPRRCEILFRPPTLVARGQCPGVCVLTDSDYTHDELSVLVDEISRFFFRATHRCLPLIPISPSAP